MSINRKIDIVITDFVRNCHCSDDVAITEYVIRVIAVHKKRFIENALSGLWFDTDRQNYALSVSKVLFTTIFQIIKFTCM